MLSIQPCALLVSVGPDWQIDAISANAAMLGDQRPADLLCQPLAALIGGKSIHALRNRLAWLAKDESEVYDFGVEWGGIALDIRASRDGDNHLIEAELAIEPRLPDGIGMVRSMSDRLSGDDPQIVAEQAMRQLCALTGFEQVSLLDRNGVTIASPGRTAMKPVEQHGPPIATQVVADLEAEAVAVFGDVKAAAAKICFAAPDDGRKKALSAAGIGAAMSFPLKIDNEPLATLQAHHPSARRCSAERRSVTHLFAERLVARMARQGWIP